MRGVRSLGARSVEVCDWPDPEPQGDEVVVRVDAASICGSDLHSIYRKKSPHSVIPGHEGMGEVVAVDSARHVRVGDRVMILAIIGCGRCRWCREGDFSLCEAKRGVLGFDRNGVHAEFAMVPESALLPLPEYVRDEAAACILDPVGTTYHALKRMSARADHTVGVFGLGPMGLGGVLVSSFLGAEVIGLDPIAFRREHAEGLGATHTLDPTSCDAVEAIEDLTRGRGLDMALECSGNAEALRQALDSVRPKGAVSIIGEAAEAVISPSAHFNRKEITLCGSTCFPMSDYQDILNCIQRGLDASRLITHRFALEDAVDAYASFDRGRTGKVTFLRELSTANTTLEPTP